MLIDLLEVAITSPATTSPRTCQADVAMAAFPAKLSEFAVRAALKPIFVVQSQFWQSTTAALTLLDSFIERNPKAVAACLPRSSPSSRR